MRQRLFFSSLILFVFACGFISGRFGQTQVEMIAEAETQNRVFELRTYTTNEGKLDALQQRFRNHTTKLFQKHGMTNIGYWISQDAPLNQNTLIYLLAYPSREAAKKSWESFRNDPEWQKVRTASEANGKIVSRVDSVFLDPTDYSPLK